jgi:protein phosphatase
MNTGDLPIEFPLCGTKKAKENSTFGIFDGMGGEECGEVASYIAAQDAAALKIGNDAAADLSRFCYKANEDICEYARLHQVSAMGTTAAMLVFTKKQIALCNIGDSKVFRFSDGELKQISVDHIAVSAYRIKPPLSQNLGIPPSEMIIEPYLAQGKYTDGDVFLICSDGLTDMVSVERICSVLDSEPIKNAVMTLLEESLANGGRDNITIILCKIERSPRCLFKRRRRVKRKEV